MNNYMMEEEVNYSMRRGKYNPFIELSVKHETIVTGFKQFYPQNDL